MFDFLPLPLPFWLIDRCETLGFKGPTEVQSMGLPLILEGKDVILQAQTGSGKTLLYVLPVLANIDPSRAAIQAVIIVPTRELATQINNVFIKLLLNLDISIMLLIGGNSLLTDIKLM